jgi:UPF0716 protein FxsA
VFLLALLFVIGIPVLEIYVIVRVGEAIGALPTIALLVATSLLGVRLMRSQGRAVVRNFSAAIAAGRPPAREALDGALVFIGGALLVAPGFVTDVVGAVLLVPPTRALVRRWIVHHYAGRFVTFVAGAPRRKGQGPGGGDPYDVEGTAVELDRHELDR